VLVQRLHPEPGEVDVAETAASLGLADLASATRPYLALNMVASLDGKATLEGRTRHLGGEADRELFHALRRHSDAVMVGAGTVRAERYGRIEKDETLTSPLAVVVSRSGHLPADLPLLSAPGQEVLIDDGRDLPGLLARLREERGVRSVLCEGGPTLNGYLFSAGLVDELFLCLSPKVVGHGEALSIVAGRELPEPREAELVWMLRHQQDLFFRWRFAH